MEWLLLLEALYYICGITLVIGLFFAYRQVKIANDNITLASEHLVLLKKDMNDRHKRASVEKSLEYLDMYANEIIPKINEYNYIINEKLKKERRAVYTPNHNDFNINPKILEKYQLREIIVKQNNGLIHILNKLELFSVAILNGLVDEDLVYTPVARIYCSFIEREYIYLSILRNSGTPYKNLVELYNKWSDRIEYESLTLQLEETKDKMKLKDDTHENEKPIGVTS